MNSDHRAGPRRRSRGGQRRRQIDAVPVRRRPGARTSSAARSTGTRHDRRARHQRRRRRTSWRSTSASSSRKSQTQITAARRASGRRSRSARATCRCRATRSIERTWSGDRHRFGCATSSIAIPSRLSGGQAQLVALAAVLALGPRYLVLDEPTSQLDPLGTRLVGETLARAARETGVGVLIAEHKTDLLARMCDEVAVISGGAIVVAARPAATSSAIPRWRLGRRAARRRRAAPGCRRGRADSGKAQTGRDAASSSPTERPGLRVPGRHARADRTCR